MSEKRSYGLIATPWTTALLGCFAQPKESLDICLCAPCSISRQMKAIEGQQDTFDPEWCCASSVCGACASACLRQRVVTKYGLDETLPMTTGIAWCCAACSLCQTWRELSGRGANPGLTVFRHAEAQYQAMS